MYTSYSSTVLGSAVPTAAFPQRVLLSIKNLQVIICLIRSTAVGAVPCWRVLPREQYPAGE